MREGLGSKDDNPVEAARTNDHMLKNEKGVVENGANTCRPVRNRRGIKKEPSTTPMESKYKVGSDSAGKRRYKDRLDKTGRSKLRAGGDREALRRALRTT